MLNIGVIGFGRRIESIVQKLTKSGEVKLCAICDILSYDEVKEKRKQFVFSDDIKFYSDAEKMLENENLDGICISTTCSSHTAYAVLAAKYNIPIFLEKPVCIKEEDLERLKTILHLNDKIVVSFPLRLTPMAANDIDDRINFINMETGDVVTYNQGKAMGGGIEVAAHEAWSYDGEYLYAVVMGGRTERNILNASVGVGGLIRINKDGTHRQYYKPGTFESGTNHCFPSSDNKWLAADSTFVTLTNLETHQVFPIAQSYRIIGASKAHPYHPHAQIATGHNIMSWGHVYQGVLGVAWCSFDDIANNEVAKGGRYPINEYVERVSYVNLECESNEVELNGRVCQTSIEGKGIFCAINPEIVDSTDDRIKITFDYLDNSIDPITLTYTRGVKNNSNDALLRFNAEVKVSRRATGTWKTAELIINSANCESIGTYETDFALRGGSKELFVSNIKVEKLN